MAVNGKSIWLGCKYVIGQMLKQEPHSSGDRGWIINLSSIFGLVGSRIARKSSRTASMLEQGRISYTDVVQHRTPHPKGPCPTSREV